MQCPQCGHEESSGDECEHCGIIFSKLRPREAAAPRESSALEELFRDANVLRLNENPRSTLSMLTGWPVARAFDVVDSIGRERGTVAQSRMWFSIEFAVFNSPGQQLAMNLQRPFFAFLSEMVVSGARSERIGSAKRRFSMLRKTYDLRDAFGQTFATIASPVMHPWTFPIFDRSGQQRGEIAKKWTEMTEELGRAEIQDRLHEPRLAGRAARGDSGDGVEHRLRFLRNEAKPRHYGDSLESGSFVRS